ncbi:snare associated Golgi protein-domain-containing protein [Syncephalis fuscata]|nr:snare associated Golgi protein-domain-containing protein [Syncephalis fuscata]
MNILRNYRKLFVFLKRWLLQQIPSQWHRFIPLAIVGLIYSTIGILFLIYIKDLLPVLERLGIWLRNCGVWGPILLASLICLTGFPFMPGYSTLITMSGFVFGVSLGYATAFVGGLLSACTSFIICRRYARKYTEKLASSSRHLSAVLYAVERRGWKLLLLVRLAPYPYNLLNALLSMTSISFRLFALTTAASLTKIIAHVLIGANMISLVEAFHRPTAGKIALATVGGVLAVSITIYLYIIARRAVAEDEAFGIYRLNANMANVADFDIAMEEGPWQLASSDDDDEEHKFNIGGVHNATHSQWNTEYNQVTPTALTAPALVASA